MTRLAPSERCEALTAARERCTHEWWHVINGRRACTIHNRQFARCGEIEFYDPDQRY